MPSASKELSIPHPQADVASPIPGDAANDALFAELEALNTPAPVQASPEPTPAPEVPAPVAEAPAPTDIPAAVPAATPPVAATPNVPAVDDVFAELQSFAKDTEIKNAPTKEGGEGAPTYARFIANIGKEPEVQRQLLQRTLGLEFDTKTEDDAVWFRKKGETHFLRMDPNDWRGASEFLKDMTIDIAPDIGEQLITAAVAAMAARSGAAIRGGGPRAAAGQTDLSKRYEMPDQGIARTLAGNKYLASGTGVGVGATAGAQARSEIINALGVPNEPDLKKEVALNVLSDLGGTVIMQAVRRPSAAILDRVASALGQMKVARVGQMAKVREGVEEFAKESGLPAPHAGVGPNAALGRQVETVLDVTEARLGKQVGLVKQKALSAAGNNPLPVNKYMERAKEILESEGVEFDPAKGFAKLPADYQKLKPFGDSSGQVLKQVVEDYNAALRNNGMPMNQIFNNLDFYKNEAGFQKALPDTANTVYQRLRGALREDRDAALMQVLPQGSQEHQFAKKAFTEFKDNIDELRKLQKLANKSPEKFADSLIAPKESVRIQQLKQVLGPESDAFSNVKSAWFSKVINKAVDPDTGLVGGAILKKELDKYGPDVLNELMTPAQQNVLKVLAGKAEKIHIGDLIENPGESSFFKDLVRSSVNGVSSPEAKFRIVWSMFGSNKKVAKYLSNEGLLNLAKEIKDPTARSNTLKAAEWMAKVIRISDVKKNAKGIEMLKPPLDVATMAGIISAMEQNVDESMPEYLQRRKTQLNELRQEHNLPIDNPDEAAGQ